MNQASFPASRLESHQRQQIALRVLTKQETISGMAGSEGFSRKFRDKNIPIRWNPWGLSDFKAPDRLA